MNALQIKKLTVDQAVQLLTPGPSRRPSQFRKRQAIFQTLSICEQFLHLYPQQRTNTRQCLRSFCLYVCLSVCLFVCLSVYIRPYSMTKFTTESDQTRWDHFSQDPAQPADPSGLGLRGQFLWLRTT